MHNINKKWLVTFCGHVGVCIYNKSTWAKVCVWVRKGWGDVQVCPCVSRDSLRKHGKKYGSWSLTGWTSLIYIVREASTKGIPLIEICNKPLLLNDTLNSLPFVSFKCCESVVLYIILLKVARELSRFCKMARRSK